MAGWFMLNSDWKIISLSLSRCFEEIFAGRLTREMKTCIKKILMSLLKSHGKPQPYHNSQVSWNLNMTKLLHGNWWYVFKSEHNNDYNNGFFSFLKMRTGKKDKLVTISKPQKTLSTVFLNAKLSKDLPRWLNITFFGKKRCSFCVIVFFMGKVASWKWKNYNSAIIIFRYSDFTMWNSKLLTFSPSIYIQKSKTPYVILKLSLGPRIA